MYRLGPRQLLTQHLCQPRFLCLTKGLKEAWAAQVGIDQ
jgi:hypothetical protein